MNGTRAADLASGVVSKYLVADRRGAPALYLMSKVEDGEARGATPVVRLPVSQYREECALAAVDAPSYRHLDVDVCVLVVLSSETDAVGKAPVSSGDGEARARQSGTPQRELSDHCTPHQIAYTAASLHTIAAR